MAERRLPSALFAASFSLDHSPYIVLGPWPERRRRARVAATARADRDICETMPS